MLSAVKGLIFRKELDWLYFHIAFILKEHIESYKKIVWNNNTVV